MTRQRNEELIEEGRQAVMAAGAIREEVNKQIEQTLASMIAHYRMGTISHDYLVGRLGEINGLQTLMSNLENKAQRGAVAMEREVSNAP